MPVSTACRQRVDERVDAATDRIMAAFRADSNQAVVVQSRLLIIALFTALAVAVTMLGTVQLTS